MIPGTNDLPDQQSEKGTARELDMLGRCNELLSLTSLLKGHALKQVRLYPAHETGNGLNLAGRLVGGHGFSYAVSSRGRSAAVDSRHWNWAAAFRAGNLHLVDD